MFLVSIVIVWIMLMILASWTNFFLIIFEWTLHSSDWVRRLFGVGVYLISFSQIYEKDLCLLRRMYWYETFHWRIILATAPFRHMSCCFKRIVTSILSCPFFFLWSGWKKSRKRKACKLLALWRCINVCYHYLPIRKKKRKRKALLIWPSNAFLFWL